MSKRTMKMTPGASFGAKPEGEQVALGYPGQGKPTVFRKAKRGLFALLFLLLTLVPVGVMAAPKLSAKKLTMEVGGKEKLKVKKGGFYKISSTTWTSSNKQVAKVSKTGKVTAKKAGKATITAKVKAVKTKGKKAKTYRLTCTVTVKAVATPTPSPRPTATPTPTATSTPRPTATPTPRPTATPSPLPTATPLPTQTPAAKKSLVVYFSRAGENYSVGTVSEGNTKMLAELVAQETGAELFEIVPVNPYPVSYNEMLQVAQQERAAKARPSYVGDVPDWNQVERVYLGYPIWHGDMPMIVYSFIEKHSWEGKVIAPFNTHEGSGSAGTWSTLSSLCRGGRILSGLSVYGRTAQNEREEARSRVATWVNGLSW